MSILDFLFSYNHLNQKTVSSYIIKRDGIDIICSESTLLSFIWATRWKISSFFHFKMFFFHRELINIHYQFSYRVPLKFKGYHAYLLNGTSAEITFTIPLMYLCSHFVIDPCNAIYATDLGGLNYSELIWIFNINLKTLITYIHFAWVTVSRIFLNP